MVNAIKEKRKRSLLKNMVLKVIETKKELNAEKVHHLESIKSSTKPKSDNDLLRIIDVENEYGISRKTIDRMRARGLKTSQSSSKSTVWIERKYLENFLKRDRYAR